MDKVKNIKITLGAIYLLIICIFLWFFFSKFSIQDFTSFEFIKSNTEILNDIKNKNTTTLLFLFFIFTVLWVLLLGFGSPVFLMGGFLFGKWLGTLVVVLGLSVGATCLYILGNYILKDIKKKKFSSRFVSLSEKFKKNEFLYFVIYRAIGGIPFFLQNLIPTLFNISIKNYFFGSIIGLAPQLFIGVSLGSGLNDIIEKNEKTPSLSQMVTSPEIYFPILGIVIIFIIAFISRKKFFKN